MRKCVSVCVVRRSTDGITMGCDMAHRWRDPFGSDECVMSVLYLAQRTAVDGDFKGLGHSVHGWETRVVAAHHDLHFCVIFIIF